jgi:hypothetical protein
MVIAMWSVSNRGGTSNLRSAVTSLQCVLYSQGFREV